MTDGRKRQSARNGHPLLHAAGKRLRIGILKTAKPDILNLTAPPSLCAAFPDAVDLQSVSYVTSDRQPGKRSVFLEDHAAVLARTMYRLFIHQDFSRIGLGQDRRSNAAE
jgi:hypothetical protein